MKASIDIETTGLEPAGVAVVSAAIVLFDGTMVFDSVTEVGYWRLDARWVPGRRDRATYDWWEKQYIGARVEAFGGMTLPWQFCEEFSQFVADSKPDELWANPARFDFGHLRELYHQLNHEFPFSYKLERDLPTLKALARRRAAHRSPAELDALNARLQQIYDSNKHEHSALADAVEQAKMIRALTDYVNG